MRGAKGGFWDRLFARMRRRKIIKQKKQKLLEEEKNNVKKENLSKKKKDELNVLLVLSNDNKFELKTKNRRFKIHKKGISTKILTYPKDAKKMIKKIVVKNIKNNSKGLDTNIKNGNISPKIESKNVTIISKKKITKKKKDISNNKIITTRNTKKQLNEKSNKLINELNKIINDNRNKIHEITLELDKLKNDLNEARTIKKVEEIEEKLKELKRKLIELIENYTKIKEGSITSLKNEEIKELIVDINKLDPNFNFDEIINKVTPNLDYYSDMSNNTIETVNMIYSSSYQKDIINYKNNEEHNMNVELKDFNEINSRLSLELDKNKNMIKEFNVLINKISPKKIVKVQSDFLATMIHNTRCLIGAFLSIPFLKKPKNIPLFTFGLFTINNSIRSMRKVTTTETINYIPSNDYANQIIKHKNSLNFADYMISDTLYQIRELKEEYIINFGSYHNSEEFEKNLKKIESMEDKMLKQSKEIESLKNKYQSTLDKNYGKVLSIKNNK